MKKFRLLLFSFPFALMTIAQQTIALYPGPIPNSKPGPDKESSEITSDSHILLISQVSRPTLTVYLPEKKIANGAGIIIFPGGGYHILAASHEGSDVARQFVEHGIAAFVLKYRIPDDATMVDKETGPLMDAQRAIQMVRERAVAWNIDPRRVGIMGFSAGGHLASTAGTHYSKALIDNKYKTSLRPDFMVLVYPVISFSDSIGHIGSRDNLLGKNPTEEKIRAYSNELQVTAATPPTFLVHAKDDDGVKVNNSIRFYEALGKNKVARGIYLYEKGGHGFGLNNPTSPVKWMDLVLAWLKGQKILN